MVLGLYRQKGSKIWWMNLTLDGTRIRRSTGTSDKKLAEAILAKVMTLHLEGKWFDLDQARLRTLEELRDRYLKERSSRKAKLSQVRDRGCFCHLLAFFGNCSLADITSRKINEYKEHRLTHVSSQSVVKELGILRNAFNVAIKEWEWCKDNPVSRISMPKLPQGRVRHLDKKGLNDLLSASESWFRPIVLTAVYTGMRQGNILSLTWKQVDLQGRYITLEETKNGERQLIPMHEELSRVFMGLSKVRLLGSDLVFHRDGRPLKKMTVSRALKRACSIAGIEDFRFHDLRHTFASLLIEAGEELYTVQRLLGHKDGRMTQRYAHMKYEKLARAVSSLGGLCHNFVIVGDEKRGHIAVTP